MHKFAIAAPVLPGRRADEVPAIFAGRMDEYEESRRRLGFSMERVFDMPTPMGNFAIGYIESETDSATAMGRMVSSELPIDRDFAAALREVHGFDPATAPPGPPPEVLAEWVDERVSERKRGLAFIAPVLPGRSDAGREFAREAYVTRRAEFAESRRALGGAREIVMLLSGPQGDVVCVYVEGDDPAAANTRFAASRTPFDTWFKDSLKSILIPEVNFDQPLPPITQIWDWQRHPVRA